MWKIWQKGKDEKVNKIQLRNKTVFEFDMADEWDIYQVSFEYDSKGDVGQMIMCIKHKGE